MSEEVKEEIEALMSIYEEDMEGNILVLKLLNNKMFFNILISLICKLFITNVTMVTIPKKPGYINQFFFSSSLKILACV